MTAVPVALPMSSPPARSQYILAGQVAVATEPTRFTTVLGSCVSVCLFDPGLNVGGINHVQMPGSPRRPDQEAWRWSVDGTEELLRQMYALGSTPSSLRAKLFGGACISTRRIPELMRIGTQNTASVLSVLRSHRVRVSNSSVGGDCGVKILFDSHTGSVWVKKLLRIND